MAEEMLAEKPVEEKPMEAKSMEVVPATEKPVEKALAEGKARAAHDEAVKGQGTMSDKIRAMANAGYARTEISKVLGIRYQHVRNVMVKSGMEGGLIKSYRAVHTKKAVPAKPERTQKNAAAKTASSRRNRQLENGSWEKLLKAGFRYVGDWGRNEKDTLYIDGEIPKVPGVYAFVLNAEVVYVGLAQGTLHKQMELYKKNLKGQKVAARIHKLITSGVADSGRLKVLVAAPEPLEWNGLPIDTAAGIAVSLIQLIDPSWNRKLA